MRQPLRAIERPEHEYTPSCLGTDLQFNRANAEHEEAP